MLGQDINTLTSCIEIKRLFWRGPGLGDRR